MHTQDQTIQDPTQLDEKLFDRVEQRQFEIDWSKKYHAEFLRRQLEQATDPREFLAISKLALELATK